MAGYRLIFFDDGWSGVSAGPSNFSYGYCILGVLSWERFLKDLPKETAGPARHRSAQGTGGRKARLQGARFGQACCQGQRGAGRTRKARPRRRMSELRRREKNRRSESSAPRSKATPFPKCWSKKPSITKAANTLSPYPRPAAVWCCSSRRRSAASTSRAYGKHTSRNSTLWPTSSPI